jgi:hypothetical protein
MSCLVCCSLGPLFFVARMATFVEPSHTPRYAHSLDDDMKKRLLAFITSSDRGELLSSVVSRPYCFICAADLNGFVG